ncbi:hypothetical protein NEOLI_000434 [Neolecta irregularis DAH-3]|uniref:FCP1 homology domain-containing protein n=1 Tax=Neolecta irregularis (strain DAH-3) TaxID=1198029 RepID=A0A1U7LWZ1_NEOID|nr:hypothetical protein NEOLI_000434 [Neolecta irregularis DAH-3]|eukprot:OLL27138.1 hypothetical protein NEOLI_000434 [Neolecta irregularis DAH-3]
MGSVGPSQGEDNPSEKQHGAPVDSAERPSVLAKDVQPADNMIQENPSEAQIFKEEKSSSTPLNSASKKRKSKKNPFSIVSNLFKCCVHPSVQEQDYPPQADITRRKESVPIEIENTAANPLTETVIVPASQTTVVTDKSYLPVDACDGRLSEKHITDDQPEVKETGNPIDSSVISPIEEGDLGTEKDIISNYGAVIGSPLLESSPQGWLLKPLEPANQGKKCLVLDLDETLVHSSFKLIHQADFVVPVEIEGQYHNVYVIKRPGVDAFMKKMGELYEVVVFTASLSKYADPVLDMLDIHKVVHHRLFRESCYNHHGNYVKDLSHLGRDLREVIIIDNSPASYVFHPANAVPISSWFNDPHDTELLDIIPFLEDLTKVNDVSAVLDMLI